MAEYKLMYFNGKGIAELCRFLFEVAEVPYEDYRWEIEDWPKYKPTSPLGQAPYLIIKEDGKTHSIGQSNTCARYFNSYSFNSNLKYRFNRLFYT